MRIEPIELSTFVWPYGPLTGETGVVVIYAVEADGHWLLFDTGIGEGHPDLAEYEITTRPIRAALEEANVPIERIEAIINCHLHFDHCGQNSALPGIPDFRPTGRMGRRPRARLHDPGMGRFRRRGLPAHRRWTPSAARRVDPANAGAHARQPVARDRLTRRTRDPGRPGMPQCGRLAGPRRGRWANARVEPRALRRVDCRNEETGSGRGLVRARPPTVAQAGLALRAAQLPAPTTASAAWSSAPGSTSRSAATASAWSSTVPARAVRPCATSALANRT